MKTTLWQTALQRHLTAFESWLNIAARTRPLTFMAAARGFAMAGTIAASNSFALFIRARRPT